MKIPRLPLEIREQLNTRLHSGEARTNLILWLNTQPAVQSILSAQFHGSQISEQDLSDWAQSGFVNWCIVRKWEAICLGCAETASKITASGFNSGTFLILLNARLAVSLIRADQDPDAPVPENAAIHKLIATVQRIHQGELKAARLALDRERLDFEREKYRDARAAGASGQGKVESEKPEPAVPPAQPPAPKPAAPATQPATKPALVAVQLAPAPAAAHPIQPAARPAHLSSLLPPSNGRSH